MTRITINDVLSSLSGAGVQQTYDIVNAIRNSASDSFQQYVPLASAENIAEVGAGIIQHPTLQNEFVTALVDRIGLVIVRSASLKNQLKKFKKGMMPQGRTIEEIYVDLTNAQQYNPDKAENEVFKRKIPNVKTLFHDRNRQDVYKQTISEDQLKTAFISWGAFGNFVSGIINALYNSAEVDEYLNMKLLIDNYYAKGLFKVIPVATPNTATNLKDFVKKVRATVTKMSLTSGSRDYNALAVHTRSDISDLHLFVSADLMAEMDVEVLAQAFNMGKAEFLGNITVIDGFASTGLEAVLVDKDWFMVYDNMIKMNNIYNPLGLYWNYMLHIWQTLSVSRFANAVAFASGTLPKVTNVIVSPTILALKQGQSHEFTATVRQTDSVSRDVAWSVVAGTGTTVASGTTIDSDGKLTVASDQMMGDLIVKATVTIAEGETVVGEAIVNIYA